MSKKKNSKSLSQSSSGLTFERRKTRPVKIGDVSIGGGAPIVVQSMTKTHTKDIEGTVSQIKRLEKAGCEVVRLAVPDKESVEALGKIKKRVTVPLVADIHFDHKLALASLDKGVDALRINPGNIGAKEKVREVVQAAKDHAVPIRIGVNSGSLEKNLFRKYGKATAEAMVESALRHVRILEDMDFQDIKISLKAPDVFRTVKAYQLLAEEVDYPFHAGITESGSLVPGSIRSSVGLALLLSQGLVDTVRVSLTAPPEEEVRVAFLILSNLGLRSYGPHIVSCPICGRCEVDLMNIAQEIEKRLATVKSDIHLAVMGCMVNGPGEAKEADIGLACGRGKGVLFKEGKVYRQLEEKEIISEFVQEVKKYEGSHKKSKA
ncbi:MAG: flavodoxin-dependent (E)-4-hydroxy-3-methylbut-2-enyl-diphosphate synthase [Candidatus Aminicenantes bacterium]|nr:MAG: flavodoxin-dependent (E)-4-hydroxy-3-methylbut-2-enyl-diphosphate synthase [Candidatus Aminicenantes bacterium]